MANSHDHDDYVRGSMDISEHKATYALFGEMTKWGSLILTVILLFIILLTCVPAAGLIGAGIASFVTAIVGYFLLR